jgi:hypothetical protein
MSNPIHPDPSAFGAVDKPGTERGTPGVAAEINELFSEHDAQAVDKPGGEGGTPGFKPTTLP